MRTTLDLNKQLMLRIRRKALEEGSSLKAVIHQALARGLDDEACRASRSSKYRLPVFSLGVPAHNLDKALDLADQMDAEAVLRKMEMRK